ncbi:MAG: HDOD domain-containing protein [Deltaproteobacteria bacterium]|nr:HDOD domain-containing protein [Deltaproteobacteria bacterium]
MTELQNLIEKLKKALTKNGDFPASAKLVNELQRLANDPRSTAQQMTDLILKEPSLGTRILGIVNSAYFRRVKPILTVSEAVVALGSRQIADICSSLLLLSKFSNYGGNNNLAKSLQKTVLTGLINSNLQSDSQEISFLAGVFRNLGEVLLHYYFPDIGDRLIKIAKSKSVSFEEAFKLVFQRELLDVVSEVLSVLNMPKFYRDFLRACSATHDVRSSTSLNVQVLDKAQKLECSYEVSSSIVACEQINSKSLSSRYPNISEEKIAAAIESAFSGLDQFEEYANIDFSSVKLNKNMFVHSSVSNFEKNDRLLDPLKQAIARNANTASLLLLGTEILKSSFSRVVLFLKSKEEPILKVRLIEGDKDGFNQEKAVIPLCSANPILECLKKQTPIFPTDGLFHNSYPIVCIPVGSWTTPIGILYADRKETPESILEITPREKDLIDRLHTLINDSIKDARQHSNNR